MSQASTQFHRHLIQLLTTIIVVVVVVIVVVVVVIVVSVIVVVVVVVIVIVVVVGVVALLLCGADEVEDDGGEVGVSVDDVTGFVDLEGVAQVLQFGREGDAVADADGVAGSVRLVSLEVSDGALADLVTVHVVHVPVECRGWDATESSACGLDPRAALGQVVGDGGRGGTPHVRLSDDGMRSVRHKHFHLICNGDQIVGGVCDDSARPIVSAQFRAG